MHKSRYPLASGLCFLFSGAVLVGLSSGGAQVLFLIAGVMFLGLGIFFLGSAFLGRK